MCSVTPAEMVQTKTSAQQFVTVSQTLDSTSEMMLRLKSENGLCDGLFDT